MTVPDAPETLPNEFSLLSAADQALYRELRVRVGSQDTRYNRFHCLDILTDSLKQIHSFCMRDDPEYGVRCLVCGVCWLSADEIAVNIRQLRLLLKKSKSTINGCLLKMRYTPVPLKGANTDRLTALIPHLKDQYLELRLWSVRRRQSAESTQEAPPALAPPAATARPADATGSNWGAELDFTFSDEERLRGERAEFLAFGSSFRQRSSLLPTVYARRTAVKWGRENQKEIPKLLRWLIPEKKSDETAERRVEIVPFNDGCERVGRSCAGGCKVTNQVRKIAEWFGMGKKRPETEAMDLE
jgi:hypothetical protein